MIKFFKKIEQKHPVLFSSFYFICIILTLIYYILKIRNFIWLFFLV